MNKKNEGRSEQTDNSFLGRFFCREGKQCFGLLKCIQRRHWIIFCLKSNKKLPSSGKKHFQLSVNVLVGLQHWNKLALQILQILQVAESHIWYSKFSVGFAQLFVCANTDSLLVLHFPPRSLYSRDAGCSKPPVISSGNTLLSCFTVAPAGSQK